MVGIASAHELSQDGHEVTVFERQRDKMLALEQLQERVKATKQAEKKLMGIDEVISGQLWK